MNPDQLSVSLAIGRCLMELGQYNDAVKQFYKAHYMDENSPAVLRSLCRALILANDLEKAKSQLEKLETSVSNYEDLILRGHLYYLQNDFGNALNAYAEAYKLSASPQEDFLKVLLADRNILMETKTDTEIFDLMIERLNYMMD